MVGRFDEPMRSIGEVAESLDLPQHVLRFWETRFKEIDPLKRAGGRRLYRSRDIEIVVAIRHLLYSEGYTIKGVQRILKEQGLNAVLADVHRRLNGETEPPAPPPAPAVPEIDAPASDGVDEAEAETTTFEAPTVELADFPDVAAPFAAAAPPAAEPRRLDEQDARLLRDALAEIQECKRLLKLTGR